MKTTARPRTEAELRSWWLDVDGLRMHAVAGGDGTPVVLLHGFGVSGAYMLPLARLLATSCAVYVPDLPGQGRSTRPKSALGIHEHAGWLGRWLDEAGLGRPLVVANSMGCQVLTALAVQRPERVGPMVLVGPTIDPARRKAKHQILGLLRESKREPATLVGLAVRDSVSDGLGLLLSVARSALADPVEDRLPLIDQPTVVVYGDVDGFLSRDWAEQVAGLLPNGRLVVVSGEAHAIHYTRPDLIAGIVSELLVEEGEHARGELRRQLEHRHMAAAEADEPRAWYEPEPVLGASRRYQPVALAPDE